jgi:membrane associated rhomboid family serine protease
VTEPEAIYCYIHPDRATRITCRRCDRPICGECMIPAAVGFQCPRCVRQHARVTRQNEGPYGGAISPNPAITTIVIIGINLAVWALLQATGASRSIWTNYLGLTPVGSCGAETPGTYYPAVTSADVCAVIPGATWRLGVTTGAVWQLVTSMFTHVQLLHIGSNLITLWFLGPPLERILGRARFLALYFLAGLTGSAFVVWLSPASSVSIGGSGAMFGLIAALFLILRKLHQDSRQILLWLGINVLITVLYHDTISWQAHLGGLIGGGAVTLLLISLPPKQRSRNQWLLLGVYAVALAALVAARALFL